MRRCANDPQGPNVERLPGWARNKIERLEAELASVQRDLKAAVGGVDGAEMIIDPHFNEIPVNARWGVRFIIGNGFVDMLARRTRVRLRRAPD
jgi:hypothetical protein